MYLQIKCPNNITGITCINYTDIIAVTWIYHTNVIVTPVYFTLAITWIYHTNIIVTPVYITPISLLPGYINQILILHQNIIIVTPVYITQISLLLPGSPTSSRCDSPRTLVPDSSTL